MSKFEEDSDGFRVVKSKHPTKNKHTKLPKKDLKFEKHDREIDIEQSLRRIDSAVEDLRSSVYLKRVIESVSTILQDKLIVEVVCFGLGQISECSIARHQLAFLICLKDYCNPRNILVHDPIFYKGECDILKRLGLHVIAENSEGNYIISEHDITLVYLPHCPKQLTNNFLWSNWSAKLQNCILICNSFVTLIDNNPSRILCESVPYIHKIYPYTCETMLENNFKFPDIFNDTSIHYFSKEKLDTVPPEFWIKGDKPVYDNIEEFITSLMVDKLNF